LGPLLSVSVSVSASVSVGVGLQAFEEQTAAEAAALSAASELQVGVGDVTPCVRLFLGGGACRPQQTVTSVDVQAWRGERRLLFYLRVYFVCTCMFACACVCVLSPLFRHTHDYQARSDQLQAQLDDFDAAQKSMIKNKEEDIKKVRRVSLASLRVACARAPVYVRVDESHAHGSLLGCKKFWWW
jgi:hypothetical protein